MSGYLLHEFVAQLEAPLRERAARKRSQRELALQEHPRPFGLAFRFALGRTLVGLGHRIQGSQAEPFRSLRDPANAAT